MYFELVISDEKEKNSYTIANKPSSSEKNLWLESSTGEGMEVPQNVLYELIDKYFNENF